MVLPPEAVGLGLWKHGVGDRNQFGKKGMEKGSWSNFRLLASGFLTGIYTLNPTS